MQIDSPSVLHNLIQKWGFLPFFQNAIEGFSIEDHTPSEFWFTDEQMAGPWEWKGPIITQWDCTYGKFFGKKAGFVSLSWLPDFLNWRRFKYPLSSYGEDAHHILEVLRKNESLLSRELKKASGFTLSRKKKFDPFGLGKKEEKNGTAADKLLVDLQMGTYVTIADFEYNFSKSGERYGWGVARYCTPEALFGEEILKACEGRSPEESRNRILEHLSSLFPNVPPSKMEKLI